MCNMVLSLAIMLLALGGSVLGAHFRGGTFKWVPLGNNRVQVTYYLSFNGFRSEENPELVGGVHKRCDVSDVQTGHLKLTPGYLKCGDMCSPNPTNCELCLEEDPGHSALDLPKMKWRCTDFDVPGNYDIGSRTFVMKIPTDTNRATIYYEYCCWVNLVNVDKKPGEQGWKMFTEIDLNHKKNGIINSSPYSSPIPLQLFHKGCDYWFEIKVTDPDNDKYHCRRTNEIDGECHKDDRKNGVCGKLKMVKVFPNCTVHFDTRGDPGNYAVRVVIEDLDEDGNPKSKVSLSFLLEVSPDDSTCDKPVIIAPAKTCTTIPAKVQYKMDIIAEAATESLPIVRIDVNKPPGMTASYIRNVNGYPFRKSKTLTWVPARDQVGAYDVGFGAVDKSNFTSEWSTFDLNVIDVPPLKPLPAKSTPSRDEEIDSPRGWSVVFNRPVRPPTQSAYIKLIGMDGRIVGQVDTFDASIVTFGSQNNIIFDMPIDDFPGKKTYTLEVGAGAVIDEQYGDVNCPLPSSTKKWLVTVGEAEATRGPPGTGRTEAPLPTEVIPTDAPKPTDGLPPPIWECDLGNAPIPIPSGSDGDECFIHLVKTSFTVTSANSVRFPYNVCCQTTCKNMISY